MDEVIGRTISHYRILEKLGEGGMGIVYKAQDVSLDRFVALKFLPSHLSASEQDKARFVLEAKAASALNHPNVCTIHAIEEHEGQLFIAMEFVEGQTLRERKQSYSLKQTIDIAAQIADGLAAAHEHGIVHRDIKPENIMIRKDGIAQIMDFGLAKLRQTTGASRLTKEGSTIGTIGYMSPEQVQGLDVDHRTDIFSLGTVLYEMLGGQLPFKGIHETAIMYEIVNVDAPPLSSIRQDIDPELDRIVLECLEKDKDERYQSAKELSKDLKRFKRESGRQRVSRTSVVREAYRGSDSASRIPLVQSGTFTVPTPAETTLPHATLPRKGLFSHQRTPWLLAIVSALVATALVAILLLRKGEVDHRVIRCSILPPARVNFNIDLGGHIAISPDGQILAFVGTDSTGRDQLWVRPLTSLTALPLPGTDDASYPFWSPDSRYIGFFASGKLKKIEASGGPALTVCDAPQGRGGTWNAAGVIVFAPASDAGLSRVAAAGGTPARITSLDSSRQEVNHRWPWFLPDGNRFLYVDQTSNAGQAENDAIYASSLDFSVHKLVLHAASNMAFVSGRLLFIRQENVVAQLFDAGSLELKGEAVPVAEQVQYSAVRSRGIFSVSENGVLVYQSGTAQLAKLAWVDENGKQLGSFGERPPTYFALLSRDGQRIVLDSYDTQSKNSDIWVYDLVRNVSTRLTYDPATEIIPCWSPDGRSIVFSSDRKGHFDLYQKNSNGTGNEELIYESKLNGYATDWSSDGRYLILSVNGDLKTKWDLWIMPMFGDRKPTVFLQTTFNEWVARFSPDARWIAYQSDESGRYEIYVRPLQNQSGKWQVSTNGGDTPFWSRDGRKLCYTSGAKLMSVDVNGTGASFQVGIPRSLFDLELGGKRAMMDVGPDGHRILMSITPGETSTPITLVTNWNSELEKR